LKQAHGDAKCALLALERRVAGMQLGLSIAMLAILSDRAAHPDLLDFASPCHTMALFRDVHLGGAVVDAHLALAIPFVGMKLISAMAPRGGGSKATLIKPLLLTNSEDGLKVS
jgi:hypothetical protein